MSQFDTWKRCFWFSLEFVELWHGHTVCGLVIRPCKIQTALQCWQPFSNNHHSVATMEIFLLVCARVQKWVFVFKLIYKFNLFPTPTFILLVMRYKCNIPCSGQRTTQSSQNMARRRVQTVQLSRPETWNHNDTFPYTRGLRLFISTVFSSTYTCTSSFRAEVSLYSS